MGKSVSCRQVSFFAVLFLVLLRLSIGWQFVYEGLWKLDTLKTERPWSAEGYLGASSGPLRDRFRGMLDDPNGFARLDYDNVVKTWDDWANQFKEKYNLDSVQRANIDAVLNGESEYSVPLDQLPEGVDVSKVKMPKGESIRYDADKRLLIASTHLIPSERDALLKLADAPPPKVAPKEEPKPEVKPEPKPADAKPADGKKEETKKEDSKKEDGKKDEAKKDDGKKAEENKTGDTKPAAHPVEKSAAPVVDKKREEIVAKYKSAVEGLYVRSTAKLGLKERLRILLVEVPDPDKVTKPTEKETADRESGERAIEVVTYAVPEDVKLDPQRPNNLMLYRKLVHRYEETLKAPRGSYEHSLIEPQRKDMLKKRSELLGPIDSLSAELVSSANKEVTPEQMKNVKPLPAPFKSKIAVTNHRTIWALLIIGSLMMAGLFTRLSSLAAAGLLLMFYLTMPPWPWVPGADEAGGTEHSLFVNKNLIEFLACMAFVFLPSGRWFGIDALIHRLIFPRRDR